MFTIVSLMREELPVIQRFLDYHFAVAGVQHILIFFDGEEGEALRGDLEGEYGDRLTLTVLQNEDYPRERDGGERPRFEIKQKYVHAHAQDLSPTEWLITLDADEFLMEQGEIPDLLAAVPETVNSVNIPVAEAVWGPDDAFGEDYGCTYFRTGFKARFRERVYWGLGPISRLLAPLVVYGRDAWLFKTNLAGHAAGRHFYRASVEFDFIGPHHVVKYGAFSTTHAKKIWRRKATIMILHYDAIGFDRWVEKMRRRVDNEIRSTLERKQRRYQFEEFAAGYEKLQTTGDEAALRALMRRAYGLTGYQFRVLKALKCAFRRRPFDKPL